MTDLAWAPQLENDPDVAYLRSRRELRLIVGGWSASGKTVFARYLADLLACQYVSASTLLTASLGLDRVDWIKDRDRLQTLRSPEVERRLDDQLVTRLGATPRIVLDSWVAPFLSKVHDAAIWIECDLEVRVQNALGPEGASSEHPALQPAVRNGLLQKDRDSVRGFRDSYGFEYGPNTEVFSVQVDISEIISPDRTRWPKERTTVLGMLVAEVSKSLQCADADQKQHSSAARP